MSHPTEPLLTAAEVTSFLEEVFPRAAAFLTIESVASHAARVRVAVSERHLRPGGTVSGPTIFTLVDSAFYVATLAMIGREALTVTSSVNVNFLARPPVADLVAEARILRLGRTLSVGDVTVWSDGRSDGPVAHATITYALPPSLRNAANSER